MKKQSMKSMECILNFIVIRIEMLLLVEMILIPSLKLFTVKFIL